MTPATRRRPALSVGILPDLTSLNTLAPALGELCDAVGAPFFSRPAFFLPWSDHAVRRGLTPRCLALRRGTELVGFAPLFTRRLRPSILGCDRLSPPLNGASTPFDILLAGDADAAVPLLAAAAARLRWTTQSFPMDLDGSVFGGAWSDWFASRGARVFRRAAPSYFRVVNKAGPAAYFAGRPRKFRNNVLRLQRRADAQCESRAYAGEGALEPHLATMRAVSERSWKDSEHMRRWMLPMLEDVARSLDRAGALILRSMHTESGPIACLLEVDDGRSVHAFHNAMDEGAKHYSPGVLLLNAGTMSALGHGRASYEFWGFRDYLAPMATDARPARSVTVESGALPARARQGVLGGIRSVMRRSEADPGRRTDEPAAG